MGRFSSLLDKARDKRKELVRRAASKAADMAMDRTRTAAEGALDSVSDAIEKAVFGNVLPRDAAPEPTKAKDKPRADDPFAKLKAKERADREVKESAPEPSPRGATDDDVDAELAALKKRLGR